MDTINWLNAIPSIMSATASVAAAVAAFASLRVSNESKSIAKQSALAVHHSAAAIALATAVDTLKRSTQTFFEVAYNTCVTWTSEIENRDHREAGGSNPRPLRHVLTNACEMLVKHGTGKGQGYRRARRSMFSIVRDGVNNLSDAEYESLLRRADGEYLDFESVFGKPSSSMLIGTAPAFRWAFYQLTRRVSKEDWREIFGKAWQDNGWLATYHAEHSKLKPVLESIIASLKSEREKLSHSAIPLESNPALLLKYNRLLDALDVLLEDCNLDLIEGYSEYTHQADLIPLVLYSMGLASLSMEVLDSVRGDM